MSFMPRGGGALDYFPCRYGVSRLLFRGPSRPLTGPYIATLGGTETYGRYVETPYPELLEKKTGRRVLNLGYSTAGVDVFLNDETVVGLCQKAEVTVVQILGAQNLSNRYYSVHPRRNDRFLKASPLLKSMYPDVDFTDFNFTRHLLAALERHSAEKFIPVAEEIRAVWVTRMRQLLSLVGRRRILLWVAGHAPGGPEDFDPRASDPLFVTRDMIEELRPLVDEVVEVVPSDAAKAEGTKGMVFQPEARACAASMPGPAVHREVADAIEAALKRT